MPSSGPVLLFLLSGLLLLRFADRQFLALLFQLPPRITRFEPVDHHPLPAPRALRAYAHLFVARQAGKSMQHVPPPGPAAGRQSERHQRLHPLLQLLLRPPPGHPLATPAVSPGVGVGPPNRRQLPLALAAGITVKDGGTFQHGLAEVHQRVMHHSLPEVGGADRSLLGIVDGEAIKTA